jgi:hypothetical protein
MKEPHWKTATEKEVWEYVAWHLAKNGIQTLLVGGAVVAIYSEGAYQSGDLDLIQLNYHDKVIPKVMESINFKKSRGRHYIHAKSQIFVEFCSGPPGIGDDVKIKPDSKVVDGQILFLYSPTDCIRDRLASYIHFKARECLDQAVLVANKFPFNRKKVKEWCVQEGAAQAYDDLIKKLKKS